MNATIDATLDIGYFDARDARTRVPAQIMLDQSGLTLVATDEKGESVLWHGERRGQGHYVLKAPSVDREGTLQRFADSVILKGFWRHGRERGFWRLHLPEDAVIPNEKRVVQLRAAAPKGRPKATRKRARRAA